MTGYYSIEEPVLVVQTSEFVYRAKHCSLNTHPSTDITQNPQLQISLLSKVIH